MTATSVKYELLMQVVLLCKSIFSLNFKNSQKVSIPVGNLLSSGDSHYRGYIPPKCRLYRTARGNKKASQTDSLVTHTVTVT